MPKLDESLLRGLPPFVRLTDAAIRGILDRANGRRFDAGEQVFAEGEPATHFFLLLDGVVRVVRITATGEQVTALHIPAGQLFGIARALGYDRYPATAIAACDLVVLAWPMALWDEFAATHDGFATDSSRTVGQRLGELHSRIVEMSTQQVEQRIARAILRLVNQTGKAVPEGIEIGFPITRQDLSEMTGTTLHTVSRTLSAWERDGLVQSQRKKITVCAPHRLVLLAEG